MVKSLGRNCVILVVIWLKIQPVFNNDAIAKADILQAPPRVLEKTRVKIVYGFIAGTPKCSPDYLRARGTQFPRTDDAALGGCLVRAQRSRPRMVCPDCIDARNEWLKEHCPTWAKTHDLDGM